MAVVFVSHSVSPSELGQVYALAEQLGYQGLRSVIPDRTWDPQDPIPLNLQQELEQAEVVLAFATITGHHVAWMNRELEAVSQKPIIALVEEGVHMHGIRQENAIVFQRWPDLARVTQTISERVQATQVRKQTANLVGALAIGGLIMLLARAVKSDKGVDKQ